MTVHEEHRRYLHLIPDALAIMEEGEPCHLFDSPELSVNYRQWAMIRDWMLEVERRIDKLENARIGQ